MGCLKAEIKRDLDSRKLRAARHRSVRCLSGSKSFGGDSPAWSLLALHGSDTRDRKRERVGTSCETPADYSGNHRPCGPFDANAPPHYWRWVHIYSERPVGAEQVQRQARAGPRLSAYLDDLIALYEERDRHVKDWEAGKTKKEIEDTGATMNSTVQKTRRASHRNVGTPKQRDSRTAFLLVVRLGVHRRRLDFRRSGGWWLGLTWLIIGTIVNWHGTCSQTLVAHRFNQRKAFRRDNMEHPLETWYLSAHE